MISAQTVFHWFAQNPLGGASVVYAAAILGVTIYAYIKHPREG
jgi:hypothetical protein